MEASSASFPLQVGPRVDHHKRVSVRFVGEIDNEWEGFGELEMGWGKWGREGGGVG